MQGRLQYTVHRWNRQVSYLVQQHLLWKHFPGARGELHDAGIKEPCYQASDAKGIHGRYAGRIKRMETAVFLSDRLTELMEKCLSEHHQMMLFLNRRGYAGFVSCISCGYVVKCPHCDVSLSEHRGGRLICHYCGHEERMIKTCPSCGSPYIGGFRMGTQQVEDLVKKRFPQARVLRMDLDTTKNKDGHEKILSAFANEEADILIGTQMIVKGHDFPGVTLVGILAADMSLYGGRLPFRRTYISTSCAGCRPCRER